MCSFPRPILALRPQEPWIWPYTDLQKPFLEDFRLLNLTVEVLRVKFETIVMTASLILNVNTLVELPLIQRPVITGSKFDKIKWFWIFFTFRFVYFHVDSDPITRILKSWDYFCWFKRVKSHKWRFLFQKYKTIIMKASWNSEISTRNLSYVGDNVTITSSKSITSATKSVTDIVFWFVRYESGSWEP